MKEDPTHRWDKLALFILAGLVVIVLGSMVAGVFWSRTVPDKGDVLLGGIATGLILFLRDLVTAVRTSWEGQQWGKMTEQLAASAPAGDLPAGEPTEVKVVNEPTDPVPTTDSGATGELALTPDMEAPKP